MGWSTNQKQLFVNHKRALAKKQRQQDKKNQKKTHQHQKKQNKKWKDETTEKKFEEKRKDEQKKIKQQQKKKQLRQLLEKEEKQLEKINKKRQQFQTKKLTQAQILVNQQKRMMEKMKGQSSSDSDEQEKNPNRAEHDFHVAKNVQEALNLLELKDDKHPEKRIKAAFEEYCQKREPILKTQNPGMKRSQRLQLLRKQFNKHPDNPFNKVNKP